MSTIFEKLMRETLKDFSIDSDGQFRGYCESHEAIDGLLTRLKSMGYAYSVRRSTHYPKHSDAARSSPRFFFQLLKGNVDIRFFGCLFSVEIVSHRECLLVPKYREKKEIAVPDHLADHVNPKKRNCIMNTKKSGCPATFSMKCVRVYPDYSVESVCAPHEIKKKVVEKLKEDLSSSNVPRSYLRFHVVASPPSQHTQSDFSSEVRE